MLTYSWWFSLKECDIIVSITAPIYLRFQINFYSLVNVRSSTSKLLPIPFNGYIVDILFRHNYLFFICTFYLYLGQSGYSGSKYCRIPAYKCFGNGQTVYIRFNPAFQKPPKVMIGLTMVDTHKDQNVRVRTSVTSVTKHGFFLKFHPWDSSITYQIGVNWMACPWTEYEWLFTCSSVYLKQSHSMMYGLAVHYNCYVCLIMAS